MGLEPKWPPPRSPYCSHSKSILFYGTTYGYVTDRRCAVDPTSDGKVSLDSFKIIKKLGEGGFGTVVLAKGRLGGGPEEVIAIKAVKKKIITSLSVPQIFAERDALKHIWFCLCPNTLLLFPK
jgi:serine/threonine protein kinase